VSYGMGQGVEKTEFLEDDALGFQWTSKVFISNLLMGGGEVNDSDRRSR
jgi:hypothetical protein